ncbi:MAG TPA: TIGR03435 family protein [Terriglobales bacterium]|nr:TIGR03435 family protein [Terriglobales bacterium]
MAVLTALALTPQLQSQSATEQNSKPPLAYEIVSIAANHSGAPGQGTRNLGDGKAFENMPVKTIIANAFDIRPDLISGGPGWLDSEPYDLSVKVSGDDVSAYRSLTEAQRNQMLAAVLADRFHLATHTVVKQLPGYTLTVAKGGFKLKPLDSKGGGWGMGPSSFKSNGISIDILAKNLSNMLHQSVVDQTGISGIYTFNLEWDITSSGTYAAASSPQPSGLPSLPVALEETLGLKLTAAKIPTPTLVIDSIEHPAQN